jgi:hypothetical protein
MRWAGNSRWAWWASCSTFSGCRSSKWRTEHLYIRPSTRNTCWGSSRCKMWSLCWHPWGVRLLWTRTRTENQWTSESTGARSAPSSTWRRRGQTYSSVCICALVFRPRRGHHIDRPSRGSSGTYSLLLVLAFGILPPWLFPFMVFLTRILLVDESRGSLLLVFVSFLGPRWCRGLPASRLVF